MLALRTVEPGGGGAVDENGVGWGRGVGGGDGHEARVDAGHTVVVERDGLAGVVEVGLGHGVVLGVELELDHVAYVGFEVVGGECEGSIASDVDDVGCDRGGGCDELVSV